RGGRGSRGSCRRHRGCRRVRGAAGGPECQVIATDRAELVALGVGRAAGRARDRRSRCGRRRCRSGTDLTSGCEGGAVRVAADLGAALVAVVGGVRQVAVGADRLGHQRVTRTVLVDRVSRVISSSSATLDFILTLPVAGSSTSTTLAS